MKILIPAVAAAAVLAVAGCGTITKAQPAAHTGPAAPASRQAAPSPPPSNNLSGAVSTVYTVTDQSGNQMSVALTKVIDPAQGADQFTTPTMATGSSARCSPSPASAVTSPTPTTTPP